MSVSLFITLEVETCITCGMTWAIPKDWKEQKRRDHTEMWCPNGHVQHYPGESDVAKEQRLRLELERKLQAELNTANHARLVAEKERDSAVRAKRKVERRIAHGVCPCCNKTFQNIASHMMTEHKDFRLPGGKKQERLTA